MALDKSKFISDLKKMMDDAYEQNWSKQMVAEELAAIIDTYIRSADVTGITTDVTVEGKAGVGTQSGTGHLE